MKRIWNVLIVIAVTIVLVVGSVWFYLRTRPITSQIKDSGPPVELSTGFDPTLNEPRFVITGVDTQAGTLGLRFVWPVSLVGREIVSKILCPETSAQIVYLPSQKVKKMNATGIIEIVQGHLGEEMLFSALCGDSKCGTMREACTLYMNDE